MLRKAIVQVAAQRAMELGEVPGMTQEERDRKYLYSFFGEDFIRELEVMDSEFLMTGNKLLSLHSMDSTSLASAMFIMALAKNTTRMQILQTFEGMMAGELPMAEQNYFEAGLTCDGKQKLFDKYCKRERFPAAVRERPLPIDPRLVRRGNRGRRHHDADPTRVRPPGPDLQEPPDRRDGTQTAHHGAGRDRGTAGESPKGTRRARKKEEEAQQETGGMLRTRMREAQKKAHACVQQLRSGRSEVRQTARSPAGAEGLRG